MEAVLDSRARRSSQVVTRANTVRLVIRLALGLSIAAVTLSPAHADDDWLGGDKRAHFLGGLVIGGITSENTGSFGAGVLLGCGVGAFGELIEVARYGWLSPRVSAKDFAAECAGAALGAYIGTQMAPNDRVASSTAKASTYGDSWTSIDKVSHFAGGAAISGLVSHHFDSATSGLISGCGVSAAGELFDAARHGWHSKHTSAKDFGAGCLGALTGAFVAIQIAPGRISWNARF